MANMKPINEMSLIEVEAQIAVLTNCLMRAREDDELPLEDDECQVSGADLVDEVCSVLDALKARRAWFANGQPLAVQP